MSTPTGAARSRWWTPGVLGVGAASLFSDSSHEMVTSLPPGFVTSTLHAGPAALGAIDGVADALTGVSKLAGGALATDPHRRGRLAASGYLGTALATALIGVTTAVWQVAGLRALAWVSRGLRSPARDLVLTDVAHSDARGRAFGVERAGDNLGAVIGPLLAALLLGWVGVRTAMLFAVFPGVLAALSISVAAREARRTLADSNERARITLSFRRLREVGAVRLFTPIACFEMGNLAATLLILRGTDLLQQNGWSPTAAASTAAVLYAGHNAVAAGASLTAGWLCDRWRAQPVLTLGAAAYVIAYLVFAIRLPTGAVVAAFLLAGAGIGLVETSESARVVEVIPEDLRSQAFGALGLVQASGDLGATVVGGALWAALSPVVGFGYAAMWMLLCVAVSINRGRWTFKEPAAT